MIPLEILIVASILVLFFVFFLLPYINSIILLTIGVTLIILGLLFGVPIGFYYHILLFQRRRLIDHSLKYWWISPQRNHKYLPGKDQEVLNRWFWIGAIFFNLSIIGCVLVFISLFMDNRLPN